MQRAVPIPWSEEKTETIRAMCEEKGWDLNAMVRDHLSTEIWMNDRYTAHVDRFTQGTGVAHISFRRSDRRPVRDWRDVQRIKNDIAGEHIWAMEIYPDEDHLVDGANQYHLWCLHPGEVPPFGWVEGRMTGTAEEAARIGAVQR